MEETHRHDGVEAIVGERQAGGVAAHELEVVVDPGPLGLLPALLEHRPGDVEADHVRPALGQHDGEPTRATGDLEDVRVVDGPDRIEDRLFLAPVDEATAPGEALVLVLLGDIVLLVPLLSLHSLAHHPGPENKTILKRVGHIHTPNRPDPPLPERPQISGIDAKSVTNKTRPRPNTADSTEFPAESAGKDRSRLSAVPAIYVREICIRTHNMHLVIRIVWTHI